MKKLSTSLCAFFLVCAFAGCSMPDSAVSSISSSKNTLWVSSESSTSDSKSQIDIATEIRFLNVLEAAQFLQTQANNEVAHETQIVPEMLGYGSYIEDLPIAEYDTVTEIYADEIRICGKKDMTPVAI